jgi:hypothetical protein
MKAVTLVVTLLTMTVATNALNLNLFDDDFDNKDIKFPDNNNNNDNDNSVGTVTSCECDISKCPSGGEKSCDCIVGMLDKCFNDQVQAGLNCGKPQYPQGCELKDGGKDSISNMACGGASGNQCGANEFCFFPNRSCDPHGTECTGLCANDYCGGEWNKECPDERWTCVLDDECERNGGEDCDGRCKLN